MSRVNDTDSLEENDLDFDEMHGSCKEELEHDFLPDWLGKVIDRQDPSEMSEILIEMSKHIENSAVHEEMRGWLMSKNASDKKTEQKVQRTNVWKDLANKIRKNEPKLPKYAVAYRIISELEAEGSPHAKYSVDTIARAIKKP